MFDLVAITIALKSLKYLKNSMKFGRIYRALHPAKYLKSACTAITIGIISILSQVQIQNNHKNNQNLVKLLRFVMLQNPHSSKQIP